MNTKEILIAAKNKIATHETWTTDVIARNATWAVVLPTDPGAVRWCALGAVEVAAAELGASHEDYEEAIRVLGRDRCEIADVNDWDGFDAVHAMFDAAIKGVS